MTKGLVTNGGNDRLPKGNRPRRCSVDVTNRGVIPSATQAMIGLCYDINPNSIIITTLTGSS